MKKINIMAADRRLTSEVFDYMYNSVWAWEYHDELAEAIQEQQDMISAFEKTRHTWDAPEDIDRKIAECKDMIEKYTKAYNEIVRPWTKIKFSEEVKTLTKDFENAGTRAQIYNAFVRFFEAYGVDAEGTDFVDALCDAVSGDSASGNRKPVTTTGTWSITKRTPSEFKKIVMRRLADKLIYTGLIRFYGPFNVRTSTESCEFDLELPSMVEQKAKLEIAKQAAKAEKRAKRAKKADK